MKKLFLFVIIPSLCWGQLNFEFEPEAFPIDVEGWQPFVGWSGGLYSSSPKMADIDSDGDIDFFVGHFWGGIATFLNTGNATIPDFDFSSVNVLNTLPTLDKQASSPSMADLDADGDLDLLVGYSDGKLSYFQNNGDSVNYFFELISDFFQSIDVGYKATPSLVDIDNDDDYDLFIGESYGTISFYQNEGTPYQYNYVLVTNNFEGINVDDSAYLIFCDIDSDNDYDLFITGDSETIYYYQNDGTPENYIFTFVTGEFEDIHLQSGLSPRPVFSDIDSDRDYDLFIGTVNPDGPDGGDIYFYENIGDSLNYSFEYVCRNYLYFDIGDNSAPTFTDLNNDGKKEMYIGEQQGVIFKIENVGTEYEPVFFQVPGNWMDISVWKIAVPYFCDIDADGDSDMFLGKYTFWYSPHGVEYWENTGSPSDPEFTYRYDIVTQDPNGHHDGTAPALCDIDNDGDYDLFIGEDFGGIMGEWGHIIFFENQGTPYRPNFIFQTWQYQDIDVDLYSAPRFCDIDNDGDYDLFIGDCSGGIHHFENVGTPDSACFELITDNFLNCGDNYNISQEKPTFCDIDNDGDYDFFFGRSAGGITFYRNYGNSKVPDFRREFGLNDYRLYPNYPNPFNNSTTITFSLPTYSPVEIAVYDNLGRKIITLINGLQPAGVHQVDWNASGFSSGVYLISLESPGMKQQARKVMLIK